MRQSSAANWKRGSHRSPCIGDLPQRRGRMICVEDRRKMTEEIEAARQAGARLEACRVVTLDPCLDLSVRVKRPAA
jgi:hypothetical protein